MCFYLGKRKKPAWEATLNEVELMLVYLRGNLLKLALGIIKKLLFYPTSISPKDF